MKVLVYTGDQDPHAIKAYLDPDFPGLTILAARTEDEVGDFIESADILITLNPPEALVARGKRLQWIQSIITGTDYIEQLPSFQARKDLILTSMRGIHGPQMSELAMMMMIALSRKLHHFLRNQDRRVWDRWPTTLLQNKTAVILGVGVIGEAIARKCKAFEMKVIGVDPVQRPLDALDAFYGLDRLPEAAGEADYFLSVAPSTPRNQGMLNAEFFSRLKPTAFFINLGRGEIVDEQAMIQVLENRGIAGAALDTFQQEPLPAESPFWALDNIIITPHVGGMCDVYIQQTAPTVIENMRRFLKGERRELINFIERT